MAFVPLQAQKVNPTAATDQGAEKKRTRLANTLTHHPSSSARRPADQPGRATGEWEPNQLQTALFPCVAWVVLGSLLAPPPPVPMLPNWRDGLGNRAQTGQWKAWDMGHCWELGVGAPPPPPSSGRSILGGPDESLGPARATGQLIKTSPSPQSSAWPGNCLLPPFSNLSIPFVPRRVCSLPCFLEHILYCRCRWPTPHALQRLSLISVQSGDGLRRPPRALHLSVVAIDWSLC